MRLFALAALCVLAGCATRQEQDGWQTDAPEVEPMSLRKPEYRVQLIRNLNFDAGDPPFYLEYALDGCEYRCTYDNYATVNQTIQWVKARGGEIIKTPGQTRQINVRMWEQRIITEIP